MQLRRLIPQRTAITVALLALGMTASSGASAAAQEQPSAFRVAVDLVPVDVQVLDRQGHPVVDLTPGEFDVTINGRRRRVISAALVNDRSTRPVEKTSQPRRAGFRRCGRWTGCRDRNRLPQHQRRGDPRRDRRRPRVHQSIDSRRSGRSLHLSDRPRIDPTTDHAAVIRALGQVVGQRENALTSLQFQLRPSELDRFQRRSSREARPNITFRRQRPAHGQCGEEAVRTSRSRAQVADGAVSSGRRLSKPLGTSDGTATASVGTLRGLLREMGSLAGRKILVLVTGGMIASDRPGVRPDVSDLGHQAGREAALANTAVYTLHIDVSALEHVSAQTAAADRSYGNIARDSVLLGGLARPVFG